MANFDSSNINKMGFIACVIVNFGKFGIYIQRDGYVSEGGYGYSETGDILIQRKDVATFDPNQDKEWSFGSIDLFSSVNSPTENLI